MPRVTIETNADHFTPLASRLPPACFVTLPADTSLKDVVNFVKNLNDCYLITDSAQSHQNLGAMATNLPPGCTLLVDPEINDKILTMICQQLNPGCILIPHQETNDKKLKHMLLCLRDGCILSAFKNTPSEQLAVMAEHLPSGCILMPPPNISIDTLALMLQRFTRNNAQAHPRARDDHKERINQHNTQVSAETSRLQSSSPPPRFETPPTVQSGSKRERPPRNPAKLLQNTPTQEKEEKEEKKAKRPRYKR